MAPSRLFEISPKSQFVLDPGTSLRYIGTNRDDAVRIDGPGLGPVSRTKIKRNPQGLFWYGGRAMSLASGVTRQKKFDVRGSGVFGDFADLNFLTEISGAPLRVASIITNKERYKGYPGFFFAILDDRKQEVFSVRAEPVFGSIRLCQQRSVAPEDSMEVFRDRTLALAFCDMFYGKRTGYYNREDAVNSLTYHLAKGGGVKGNLTNIWLSGNRGYVNEAQRIIDNLPEIVERALSTGFSTPVDNVVDRIPAPISVRRN